jgi:phosphatidylserine/phosphatidylglycerophosphate/cardiolipin synthase-like enzyme
MKLRRGLLIALSLWALAGCGTPSLSPLLSNNPSHALFKASSIKESNLSLLVMPEMGVKPVLDAIRGAKKSILLEMYMFTNTSLTSQLIQALTDQAKAGVDVQVLLDPHPYNPSGGSNANADATKALSSGGVKVKTSNPKFVYTHEKAMVIDKTTAYIMTMNFTSAAFTKNREYAVVDKEQVDVTEVGRIFEADWNQQAISPQAPNLVVSPDNSRRKVLDLIDSAQSTILLQCEYLTDPGVAAHLGARAKAGVDVTVMLSSGSSNDQEASLLKEQGVSKVAFIKRLTLHAKAIVVDRKDAYVGSENFTANSLDNNREMGILIHDPAVVDKLSSTAQGDWNKR